MAVATRLTEHGLQKIMEHAGFIYFCNTTGCYEIAPDESLDQVESRLSAALVAINDFFNPPPPESNQ